MTFRFRRLICCSLMLTCLVSCKTTKNTRSVTSSENLPIFEIKTISEIEKFITKDSLVLFDLDHTIFEGAEIYGHANWFYDQIREGINTGIAAEDTIRRIFPTWLLSQETCRVKPVESITPILIKALQARGLPVMGLTARQTPLINATLRQLRDIDVSFAASSLMPAIFGAREFSAPVAFREGILFTTEYVKKSHVLNTYLKRIGYSPQHVVFIDDSMSHLKDVVGNLNADGVLAVGLHYPLVEQQRHTWDSSAAALEFERRANTTNSPPKIFINKN